MKYNHHNFSLPFSATGKVFSFGAGGDGQLGHSDTEVFENFRVLFENPSRIFHNILNSYSQRKVIAMIRGMGCAHSKE